MGLFSRNKSSNSSNSTANTYVDRAQAPYLDDIRNQARNLNMAGMPVEGVADINGTLGNALALGNESGLMQASAGADLMSQGSGLTRGSGSALNFSNMAMRGGAGRGIGTALRTGNRFAQGTRGMGAATGSGVNHNMANAMGSNASQMNAAFNNGINLSQARGVGGLSQNSQAASVNGYNSGLATQAGNLATTADVAQNSGVNQTNLGSYINNDVLNGQIDAVSRDIARNLNENELVNIDSNAVAAGGMGSSRAGVAEAIARRGAADRVADVSSQMRGDAYKTGLGIEANRASQNAQLMQSGNQYNAGAINNLTSQGLGIAGNQAGMNAGFNQQTNIANQNAANSMMSQGVNVAAGAANQNAGFSQQANTANMGAQNALIGQGYGIGANQLDSNLNRVQQANAANQSAYNSARQFGTGVGQSAFNTNQQNQQFGASMAQNIGQQGLANMQAGQNMMNTGIGMSQAVGQYGRDYDQSLLQNQYQTAMSPYNSLNFYNQIVGAPNNLSTATSNTKGKNSGFSLF